MGPHQYFCAAHGEWYSSANPFGGVEKMPPASNRKPHADNAGYVAERKVKHPIGGHVVIYDREAGFDCDADYRWIVMHEPTSCHIAVKSRADAYDLMKAAVVDPNELSVQSHLDALAGKGY